MMDGWEWSPLIGHAVDIGRMRPLIPMSHLTGAPNPAVPNRKATRSRQLIKG